jgi:hypothetical protein
MFYDSPGFIMMLARLDSRVKETIYLWTRYGLTRTKGSRYQKPASGRLVMGMVALHIAGRSVGLHATRKMGAR